MITFSISESEPDCEFEIPVPEILSVDRLRIRVQYVKVLLSISVVKRSEKLFHLIIGPVPEKVVWRI